MTISDSAAQRIRLLVTDVDGVLTNGRIVLDDAGREIKRFHVADGTAVKLWQAAGRDLAVISARRSDAVRVRMDALGVKIVHQGAADKRAVLDDVLRTLGLSADQTCFIGDDLADAAAMQAVGLAVAPADADPAIRMRAHWVTRRAGGHGVLREVVEELLLRQALLADARSRVG